jgi:predicted GIY-YIG superfamily endonuclease
MYLIEKILCCFKKQREYIYVLQLFNNKWYVGRTKNIEQRLKEHRSGIGSEFTKIHQIKSLYKMWEMKINFEEDNTVKEYMMKYGINNVRGGTYSNIDIDIQTQKFLIAEFNHCMNSCFICGSTQHYSKECNKNKNKNIMTFGKYKNQPIKNVPPEYIEWCRNIVQPNHNIVNFLKIIDRNNT